MTLLTLSMYIYLISILVALLLIILNSIFKTPFQVTNMGDAFTAFLATICPIFNTLFIIPLFIILIIGDEKQTDY